MDEPRPTHPSRVKFDTLFADPRHYRGDCRLMRTAVRHGWLDDASQADRDALIARFEQASDEWAARNPDGPDGQRLRGQWHRGLLAQIWTGMEVERTNLRETMRVLRYAWAGEPPDRTTGRPRRRWHVSDHPGRIDAATIRRVAAANAGILPAAVLVSGETDGRAWTESVALGYDRTRVWLRCPGCGVRRAALFAGGSGVRCRKCARIGYAS